MKYWFSVVRQLWSENGGSAWTPLPTLDAHLKHIAAGCTFVLVGLAFGLDWWYASLLATCIALVVEGATAFSKSNWFDSGYDFLQYQAMWGIYIGVMQYWYLLFAFCAVWLYLYFYLLTHQE